MNVYAHARLALAVRDLDLAVDHATAGDVAASVRTLARVRGDLTALQQLVEIEETLATADTERPKLTLVKP